jgi:hypothetical protein
MKEDSLERGKKIANAFVLVLLIIPIFIFNVWYLYANVIMILNIDLPVLSYFHVAGLLLFIKVIMPYKKSNEPSDVEDYSIRVKTILATQIIFSIFSLIIVWLM